MLHDKLYFQKESAIPISIEKENELQLSRSTKKFHQ